MFGSRFKDKANLRKVHDVVDIYCSRW